MGGKNLKNKGVNHKHLNLINTEIIFLNYKIN